MLKIVSYLWLAMVMCAFPAFASQFKSSEVPNAQIVGQGRLSVFMLDVYDAKLYAPGGVFQDGQPFALELSYLRSIEGLKIADRSIQEMRDQGMQDEAKLQVWQDQMRKIFPDVEDGDIITGVYTQTRDAVFYKDGQEIGRIGDPDFSRAFFNIWLDEKTNAPALRRKLLGML